MVIGGKCGASYVDKEMKLIYEEHIVRNREDKRMSKYISFIVPVYNVEDYLEHCIESMIHQDIPTDYYEIILVDDGSTDLSGKICERYSQDYENIKCFRKENGGAADARNYGMEKAEGKYVLFVDSDDYIRDNILGTVIRECKQQNEPQVLFLMAQKVFPDGSTGQYDEKMSLGCLQAEHTEVVHYLAQRTTYPVSPCLKMVNREFLNQYQIFFRKGYVAEDYEWSLSIILHATRFGCCNENYYFYRQGRQGSVTSDITETYAYSLLRIIRNIESIAADEKYMDISEDVLKFAAYIYRCFLYVVSPDYKRYKEEIQKWKYLLAKKNSRDIKIIRAVSKLVGIGNTVRLLGGYKRMRKLKVVLYHNA